MIVLLHGVGFGPETLAEVAAAVPGARVVERASGSLSTQMAAVAAVAGDGDDGPWVAAGVSGGATLALALALAGAPGLERVVVHEPLVGRHAPSLWAAVQAGRADVHSPERWFSRLIGGSAAWDALPSSVRDAAVARHADLAAEIEPFVTWDPPTLTSPVPVHTTVGDRSGPARHEAAAALAAAGATVEVLDDCGHLAQLDNPEAFAEAILR